MPIILPHDLTSAEIRVLQEFRRANAESLSLDVIKAVKHPAGGGEVPAIGLVAKGFLQSNGSPDTFALTQKGKDFLAIDARPAEEAGKAASADETSAADSA